MNFLIAALPILAIVVGMAGLNYSAKVMSPIAWIIAFIAGITVFTTPLETLAAASWGGAMDGMRIVWLIFGAFLLLEVMVQSGAMDTIKGFLATVTSDKRLIILLVSIAFGTFIEGAAGFGTPAALAAPFLVGLGMDPLVAAGACLLGNSAPVCFGGGGATLPVGVGSFVDFVPVACVCGRMASLEYLLLPVIIIGFVFGIKAMKGIWKDAFAIGIAMCLLNFLISNYCANVVEFTSLIAGIIGTGLFCMWLLRTSKPAEEIPEEYRLNTEGTVIPFGKFMLAVLPYLILCILLVGVRFSFSQAALAAFGGGYCVWIGCVIVISAVIAAVITGTLDKFFNCAVVAFKHALPALIAMGFLMAMVKCMKTSGEIKALAGPLSAAAGFMYPMVAVLIGQIGAFVTGSNMGSSLMFNHLHMEAARTLGLNQTIIIAAQHVGGAIGNMICPNNIVAVCACVGILGKEGKVMRKTLLPSILFLLFLGTLAMIYQYVTSVAFAIMLVAAFLCLIAAAVYALYSHALHSDTLHSHKLRSQEAKG